MTRNSTPTTWINAHREQIVHAWEIKYRDAQNDRITDVYGIDRYGREHFLRRTFEPRAPRIAYWWVHV